jgi:hypothetical protein
VAGSIALFYPVGGSMANAALPMQCPSDTLLWVEVQSLVNGLSFFVFFISFAILPHSRAKLDI